MKTNLKKKFIVGVLMTLFAGQWAFAQAMYSYTRLALKDLDEMNAIIKQKMDESEKLGADSKVSPLREALQAVFARSNEDLMIEKIITPLKNALEDLDAWESSVNQMVDDAIKGLKDPDKIKPVAQVTYLIMLENVITEFKPKVKEKFEGGVIAKIRDAKIELSSAAAKERKLKTMKAVRSPSDTAGEVIAKAGVAPKKKK